MRYVMGILSFLSMALPVVAFARFLAELVRCIAFRIVWWCL